MASGSKGTRPGARRPRPSRALLEKLRAGKAALRQKRAALSLPEKVQMVLDLQRMQFPILKKRRPLRSWERPWDVTP